MFDTIDTTRGVTALARAALIALGVLTIVALVAAGRSAPRAARHVRVANDQRLTVQEIGRRYRRGVVEIVAMVPAGRTTGRRLDGSRAQSRGLGFAISGDGLILTSAALVDHNGRIAKTAQVTFRTAAGKTRRVVGAIACVDPVVGLAVIRVDPAQISGLEPLPMGDSSGLRAGDAVVALGAPPASPDSPALAAGSVGLTSGDLPAAYGVTVSGALLTTASVGRRGSGAPLLDMSGRVIGVMEQPGAQGGGSAELWSAAPINGAAHVISDANAG
jgi:S1-C subfamily serine protease